MRRVILIGYGCIGVLCGVLLGVGGLLVLGGAAPSLPPVTPPVNLSSVGSAVAVLGGVALITVGAMIIGFKVAKALIERACLAAIDSGGVEDGMCIRCEKRDARFSDGMCGICSPQSEFNRV